MTGLLTFGGLVVGAMGVCLAAYQPQMFVVGVVMGVVGGGAFCWGLWKGVNEA
jgi:hypothetical protein